MKFVYDEALERSEALARLCEIWTPEPPSEVVALDEALGRVTACDLRALVTLPVKRSARMDGYAVHSVAFAEGIPDASDWKEGVDYVRADTGDDFSDDFDALISVESVELNDHGGFTIVRRDLDVRPGSDVNERGSLVREGQLVVGAHTRLTPELVAALAVAGYAQVSVVKPITVAYVPTGDELVPWGSYPARGQNIEANSLLVSGMLRQWGARCVCYPIVVDDEANLESALDRALAAADLVLINGGSSRGGADYNATLLQRRASSFVHGVRAVPGRPVGMAMVDWKPVINVPGPVGAAWLCMDWLIRGLVAHWFGMPVIARPTVRARLANDFPKPAKMERITRVYLRPDPTRPGELLCVPLPRTMGAPETMATSDGLLTLPIGPDRIEAGAEVEVELLRPMELIRASWE